MANYKVVVQYDGTRYKGWQGQNSTDLTIQGKLESVLQKMVGYSVEVTGSGRTDAGVHAMGQVANFHLKKELEEQEILTCFHRHLPKDIAVMSVEKVDERFHSRYQAAGKTYLYRIHTGAIPNVFERNYFYSYDQPLDIERMRKAAAYFIGTHDFKAFCGNKKMKKSTVRTIREIQIEEQNGEIRIYYTGNGFLQNMVRIMTGTLIEVGSKRREPEQMTEIIESGERSEAGYTAPPEGLTLLKVLY